MAPGQGSSHDGRELLPLDGYLVGQLLVWLPLVIEPVTLEVGPSTEST